jgi:hypothetical protein
MGKKRRRAGNPLFACSSVPSGIEYGQMAEQSSALPPVAMG